VKKLLPYFALLRPLKVPFIGALLCGMVSGLASGLGGPYATKFLVPYLYSDHDLNTVQLALAVSTLPMVFALRGLGGFLNIYLTSYCGLKILEEIRMRLFTKLQEIHLGFFAKHRSGDLLSRIMNDTLLLQETIIRVANDLIIQPITLAGALGFLIWLSLTNMDVAFILLFLMIVTICVLPIRYLGRRLYLRAQQLQKEMGVITECVRENLSAAREVRAFNLEEAQKSKFQDMIRNFFKLQLKVVKYLKAISPSIEFVSALGISITIFYARKTGVALEDILAIIFALYFSYDPVKKIGVLIGEIRRGTASLERLEEILDTPAVIKDNADARELEKAAGRIEFSGVCFDYGDGPILHDINCVMEPGKVYALVGPSGAGKSTFTNLVPRFYDVASGAITLDGIDLRNLKMHNLRSHIALVPQDPVLFNDNIYNNIHLSRPGANEEEVYDAARKAYAHDFILKFENGYKTLVGDRGARLSGGQKQRIALARAFLKNAPILILDEATSALDAESEDKIQAALKTLIKGKTVIIIAHRFSSIKLAQEVFLFDEGRITANGSHEELMAENQTYRNLYQKQTLI